MSIFVIFGKVFRVDIPNHYIVLYLKEAGLVIVISRVAYEFNIIKFEIWLFHIKIFIFAIIKFLNTFIILSEEIGKKIKYEDIGVTSRKFTKLILLIWF